MNAAKAAMSWSPSTPPTARWKNIATASIIALAIGLLVALIVAADASHRAKKVENEMTKAQEDLKSAQSTLVAMQARMKAVVDDEGNVVVGDVDITGNVAFSKGQVQFIQGYDGSGLKIQSNNPNSATNQTWLNLVNDNKGGHVTSLYSDIVSSGTASWSQSAPPIIQGPPAAASS